MPLVESAGSFLALLMRYVWRQMEVYVIDAFDLEIGREAVVSGRNLTAAQNVNLRLDR